MVVRLSFHSRFASAVLRSVLINVEIFGTDLSLPVRQILNEISTSKRITWASTRLVTADLGFVSYLWKLNPRSHVTKPLPEAHVKNPFGSWHEPEFNFVRPPGRLVSSFSLWPALTSAQIISNRWSLVIRKWSPDQPRNYSQSQEKWMMKGKSFAFDISLSFHSQFLLGRLVSRVLTTYGPHMAVGKMKRRANHLKFPLKRLGSSSFIILLTAMASGQERNHCSFRETSDGWIPAKLLSHPSSL